MARYSFHVLPLILLLLLGSFLFSGCWLLGSRSGTEIGFSIRSPSPAPPPPPPPRIAFESTRDGNWEIYVMDADGSNPTRLTNDPAQDWGPSWST